MKKQKKLCHKKEYFFLPFKYFNAYLLLFEAEYYDV